jgi:Co/Zn/Cd efflux system component
VREAHVDKTRIALYLGMGVVTAVFTYVGVYGSGQTASLMLFAGAMHLCGDGVPYVADFCNEYFAWRKSIARLLKLSIVLCNSLFLLITTLYILWEAYQRFNSPFVVSKWVFAFACIEVAGCVMQALIELKLKHRRKHDHHGHIHHSQWDHLVGDIAASSVQAVGAFAILLLGLWWIDPAASVVDAGFTGYLCYKGLRKFFTLLMTGEKEDICSHADHH